MVAKTKQSMKTFKRKMEITYFVGIFTTTITGCSLAAGYNTIAAIGAVLTAINFIYFTVELYKYTK